jgi:hypothetical protein
MNRAIDEVENKTENDSKFLFGRGSVLNGV